MVNIYKPLPIRLQVSDLPVFPHPCLYAGDFNCLHVDWCCDANSAEGKGLVGWASTNNLTLLLTQKMPPAFALAAGIQVPTRILHSSVSIRTAGYLTDMS